MDATSLKPIIKNQACNEIPNQHLSSAKARRMLGWTAAYGVEEGLKETIEWYKDFLNKKMSSHERPHEKNIGHRSLL